jgi:hypothetical protein
MGAQLWISCGPMSISVAQLKRGKFFWCSRVSIVCKLLGFRSIESDLVGMCDPRKGM